MSKHFGHLQTHEYRQAFEQLCASHVPEAKDFDVRHFYTALRLDEWKAVLDGYDVSDTQEAVLQAVIHGKNHRKDLYHGLAIILKAGAHSPADVLCDLYRRYPGLVVLLGLSDEDLDNMLKDSDIQRIMLTLVPRDWQGSMRDHFHVLLRSIEVWLYAFYHSLPAKHKKTSAKKGVHKKK